MGEASVEVEGALVVGSSVEVGCVDVSAGGVEVVDDDLGVVDVVVGVAEVDTEVELGATAEVDEIDGGGLLIAVCELEGTTAAEVDVRLPLGSLSVGVTTGGTTGLEVLTAGGVV